MRVNLEVLKQLVRRGDDVLDFRARAGFQYGQRVDEDRWIGDQLRRLPQLRESRPRRDALPQDGLRVQLRRGR